jgi:hypothetical protein
MPLPGNLEDEAPAASPAHDKRPGLLEKIEEGVSRDRVVIFKRVARETGLKEEK